jgi:hypothetical protein
MATWGGYRNFHRENRRFTRGAWREADPATGADPTLDPRSRTRPPLRLAVQPLGPVPTSEPLRSPHWGPPEIALLDPGLPRPLRRRACRAFGSMRSSSRPSNAHKALEHRPILEEDRDAGTIESYGSVATTHCPEGRAGGEAALAPCRTAACRDAERRTLAATFLKRPRMTSRHKLDSPSGSNSTTKAALQKKALRPANGTTATHHATCRGLPGNRAMSTRSMPRSRAARLCRRNQASRSSRPPTTAVKVADTATS